MAVFLSYLSQLIFYTEAIHWPNSTNKAVRFCKKKEEKEFELK